MKKVIVASLALGAVLAAATPALAREGCGPGFHRGPYGHCRPNHDRDRVVVAPRVGIYYADRGYWDGHRYWQHRYHDHDHGDWRYR